MSVSRGVSKCPACLADVTSFQPYEGMGHISVRPSKRKVSGGKPVPDGQTVVMRIDNVAWVSHRLRKGLTNRTSNLTSSRLSSHPTRSLRTTLNLFTFVWTVTMGAPRTTW